MAMINMEGSGIYEEIEEEVEVRLETRKIVSNLERQDIEPTDENIRRAVDIITEELRDIEYDIIDDINDIERERVV